MSSSNTGESVYSSLRGSLIARSMMESSSHNEDDVEEARRVMAELGGKVVVTPYYPMICSTEIKKKIIREG